VKHGRNRTVPGRHNPCLTARLAQRR
jgi:hypothetical protein